jgi:tetratricopeptide (TPR) repeat protein/DNA-binding transcriptional ArsR family regulator
MSTSPPVIPSSSIEPGTLWVFTPSRTDPAHLEFILVQRQALLQDAVDRVVESATSGHKHHQLFVGPRGCGKSHLVTLIISRLQKDDRVKDRLCIAWLNEDETCTSLLELLLKIHASLEIRHPAEFQAAQIAEAYELKPAQALDFVSAKLLAALGTRTLLVVTENLDALFTGLQDSGQKQLRSFIQENSGVCFVATAQRLVESLTHRDNPFHGFFQTEHLKPLNVTEATDLLKNIASLHGKQDVVDFLSTSRGRSRVQALHHLSGGNHRIYIVLSQFITRDSMDSLLGPFMKMVDELTPYYQERLRWLPAQQRKIIEHLCRSEGTVAVKEIAKRLFATQQTISSQLQDLRNKGYVTANQRGRESLYEISEPLMRICVEVKENSTHEPLRLLVDFLRVWYDDKDLDDRLGVADPASASRKYLEAALLKNKKEGNLRVRLLMAELGVTKFETVIDEIRFRTGADISESLLVAMHCFQDGDKQGAIECIGEALAEECDPIQRASLLFSRGQIFGNLQQADKALRDYDTVINLPGVKGAMLAMAHLHRGISKEAKGNLNDAIEDYTIAISSNDIPVDQTTEALLNRGLAYLKKGYAQQAISDFTAVTQLSGAPRIQVARALYNRGLSYFMSGDLSQGIPDLTAVIERSGAPAIQLAQALCMRSLYFIYLKDFKQAIADSTTVTQLTGIPVDLVAGALSLRGMAYSSAGETQQALDDYTAVTQLPGVPAVRVAEVLNNRGGTYRRAGKFQQAITDFTSAIELPNIPSEQIAHVLYGRGLAYLRAKQLQEATADFERVIQTPTTESKTRIHTQLALTEVHFSEGRWNQGFEMLEQGLVLNGTHSSLHRDHVSDLINAVFSTGLPPAGRNETASRLLKIFAKHQALPSLGEAVVQHMGGVFQAGAPFPSTDNLEGWAAAWEQAGETVPDFRLSLRLLRTAVNFVKAGGKDRTLLLDLAAPERAIVEQALGLSSEPQ